MASGKLSLYEVAEEGLLIEQALIENEGEISPELEERLNRLMMEGPSKIEAAAMVVRNLEAWEQQCKDEAQRLRERAQSFANNAERLKHLMTAALDNGFNGKVKTAKFTIYTQKAPDTVAFDLREEFTLEMLQQDHPELVRTKLELDKPACKAMRERGDTLPEALFVEENIGRRYTRIR